MCVQQTVLPKVHIIPSIIYVYLDEKLIPNVKNTTPDNSYMGWSRCIMVQFWIEPIVKLQKLHWLPFARASGVRFTNLGKSVTPLIRREGLQKCIHTRKWHTWSNVAISCLLPDSADCAKQCDKQIGPCSGPLRANISAAVCACEYVYICSHEHTSMYYLFVWQGNHALTGAPEDVHFELHGDKVLRYISVFEYAVRCRYNAVYYT